MSISYNSRSYKSVTAHYITADWQHRSRVLTMSEMSGAHTGDNILAETTDVLERQYCYYNSTCFVTDKAANMKKAFRSCDWTGCTAHGISLAVKGALQEEDVRERMVAAKTAVRVLKKSGVSSTLTTTVKQVCPTRWNTELTMLESLEKVYYELQAIDRLEVRAFLEIWSLQELQDVIELLKFFGDATQQLAGDGVTSPLVAVMWEMSLKTLQGSQQDSSLVTKLKTSILELLKAKVHVTKRQLVSSMLFPKYRKLKQFSYLTDADKASTKEELVKLAAAEVSFCVSSAPGPSSSSAAGPSSRSAATASAAPQPQRRKRKAIALSLDDEDDPPPPVECLEEVPLPSDGRATAVEEVERYIQTQLSAAADCPVQFWRKASEFPLLQKVARRLLPVPATNAASERVNSLAGRTIEERRTRMAVSLVDSMILIKCSPYLIGE